MWGGIALYNDTAILVRNLLARTKKFLEVNIVDLVQLKADRQLTIMMLDTAIDTINDAIQDKK